MSANDFAVVIRKYGRLILCHRDPGEQRVLSGSRRCDVDSPVLQLARDHAGLLLRNLRASLWSSPDGALTLLVRVVGSEADRHLQYPGLHRLVVRELYRRGATH